MISIGGTWLSMCETGSGDAPPASNLSLLIPNMDRCKFASMPVASAPLVYTMPTMPTNPTGSKWILTAVCPYSNFPRAIPVPDKQAATAARALFNDVFLQYGFPAVLRSDQNKTSLLNTLLQLATVHA